MRLLTGAALLLVACSPQPEAQPPVDNAVDTPLNELPEDVKALPIGATPPAGMTGEWRVAGINGAPWEDYVGWVMTGSITSDSITLNSQCISMSRRYARDGMRLLNNPAPPLPPGVTQEPPPPMCARAWSPQEREAMQALQAAQWVYRLPDGSMVLDGPEGSITLFTQ